MMKNIYIKFLVVSIILSLLYGCQNSGQDNIVYYPNGNKRITYTIDADSSGGYIKYYENGIIEEKGTIKSGRKIGEVRYFGQDSELKAIRNYVLVESKEYMNEVVKFDKNMDTLKSESNSFSIYSYNPFYKVGELARFEIHLECPVFQDTAFIITGNFSKDFVIQDSLSLHKWIGDGFRYYLNKPIDKGFNRISGLIINQDTVENKERVQYFEIEFEGE